MSVVCLKPHHWIFNNHSWMLIVQMLQFCLLTYSLNEPRCWIPKCTKFILILFSLEALQISITICGCIPRNALNHKMHFNLKQRSLLLFVDPSADFHWTCFMREWDSAWNTFWISVSVCGCIGIFPLNGPRCWIKYQVQKMHFDLNVYVFIKRFVNLCTERAS